MDISGPVLQSAVDHDLGVGGRPPTPRSRRLSRPTILARYRATITQAADAYFVPKRRSRSAVSPAL
jgi:hypothetical protein